MSNDSMTEFLNKMEQDRARERNYTTRTGVTWPLRRIPAMIIRQMYNDQTGKPKPPVVEVTYGKKTVKEPNEKDPDYMAALEQYEEDRNFRIMVYVITRGVCYDPTRTELERLKEFFPGSSSAQLKYAWILESFDTDEEAGIMMNVILGQSIPTTEGIKDAEASFPGDTQPE